MFNLIGKVILYSALSLVCSAQVFATQYTSIRKASNLQEVDGVLPSEHQIVLYSEFISPTDFTKNRFYKMIEAQVAGASFEMAFVGRGAYKTHLSIQQMTAGLFQNIANLRYLLGSDYQVQPIDQSPQNFSFQSSRELPLGMVLVCSVRMQVYEASQIPTDILMQIQSLTGRKDQPQRVITQDMNGFNQNVLAARMFTALYPNPSGGTDVEVLSVSVFDDFPSFGSSFIEESSEQDLRGYAENLYRMK